MATGTEKINDGSGTVPVLEDLKERALAIKTLLGLPAICVDFGDVRHMIFPSEKAWGTYPQSGCFNFKNGQIAVMQDKWVVFYDSNPS